MSTSSKKVVSNAQYDSLLDLFEKQIRTLEIEYEKYFNGSERRPPENLRKQVRHLQREIDQTFTNSTQLKFRAKMLNQKLVTLQTHWNRIMRQIEEGTYIRDKRKAARQKARAEQIEAQQEAYDLSQDLGNLADLNSFSFDDLAAEIASTIDAMKTHEAPPLSTTRPLPQGPPSHQAYPHANPTNTRQPAQRPQTTTPPQTHSPQNEADEVYRRYIEARRQCNQSTDISYDKLMQSMESQKARIREKKGVANVNFDVVIKDGQAFLKPSAHD